MPGTQEIALAVERNEVHGLCGFGYTSLLTIRPNWVPDGTVRILVQENVKGSPELNQMGVPRTLDFAKTDEDRQIIELVYSQGVFGRPYILPPGVPADRVAALRKAFMAALADKELLAEAKQMKLDIEAISGRGFAGHGCQAVRDAAQHHRARQAVADLQAAVQVARAEAGFCRARSSLTAVVRAVLAGMAGAADPAAAQDSVAQFYRGKTINFVIGANIGGGNDAYARLLARHIGKHIPGTPLVVAQNMPGAGSNKAAAYLYSQAPKDGTAIGAIQPGAVLQPLLSGQKSAHDPEQVQLPRQRQQRGQSLHHALRRAGQEFS